MTVRRRRLITGGAVGWLLAALLPSAFGASVVAATPSTVSVGDAAIYEPTARTGEVALELPVTVTPASATAVSVDWRTVAGTASVADFVNAANTITIPAGAQGGTIVLAIKADKVTEGVEAFTVELTRATGATLADTTGSVTIRPPIVGLSVGDVTVLEPDAGTQTVAISATLDQAAKKDVPFTWTLVSGTGNVPSDAPAQTGSGKITKGALGAVIRVAVNGDTTDEPDETLALNISSVTNAALGDSAGLVTLRNGDVPPPPPDPFGWTPPAGSIPASGTVLYIQSPTGDYIGRGQTYRFTKADAVIGVTTQGRSVTVNLTAEARWTLNLAEGGDGPMVTGYWPDVHRYPFFNPGLSYSGDGRGCNTLNGRFIVDQVSYGAGGVLSTLTARFGQRCEGTGPELLGYFRYDAADPTVPPPPGDPAAFTWHPPVGAVPATGNYLYFESTPGDYIGQGQTQLYTEPTATFTPDWGGSLVQLFVNSPGGWSADFKGQDQQPRLTTGLYENVRRYPFHNPTKGGLDFSGMGRGCNELLGTFAVDAIAYDGTGQLQSVSIRFVQRCELTGPPLYGALRWERGA